MNVTDSSAEIKITYKELNQAVEDLTRLSESIKNRQINLSFTKAQGAIPEKLVVLAEEMQNVGFQLGLIVEKTAQWMKNVDREFKAADECSAGIYKK